jgi:hypothetical protein
MLPFAFHYTSWHYGKGTRDLLAIWGNFLWFFFNFFSITTLLRTFFAPFQRLGEGYSKSFDPGQWAQTFLVNMIMRVTGAVLRALLIIVGLIVLAITVVFGAVMFVIWLLAPLFLLVLVASAFIFLTVA